METDADFKEMTGTGIDDVDVASITEIDEEETDVPVVDDDAAVLLDTDDGSLSEEEETDDMLEYIYGDSLSSR